MQIQINKKIAWKKEKNIMDHTDCNVFVCV